MSSVLPREGNEMKKKKNHSSVYKRKQELNKSAGVESSNKLWGHKSKKHRCKNEMQCQRK